MTPVLYLAVGCLGVSASLAQLTLMRELLGAFSGNELVFGVVLGNWMLLTGIGSALGRRAAGLKSPLAALVAVQVLVALLPIVDVVLLRTLRNVVFVRGVEIGVTDTVVSCFVILAPYCLAVGYGLTLASLILASEKDAAGIGRVYFLDNVGMVAGGALFTFVLVPWLDHFAILYLSALLNLLLAGVVASRFCGRGTFVAVGLAAAAVVALAAGGNLDARSTAMEFAPQRVAYRACSPYGRLIVTESAGQYNFMENGVALFSSDDMKRVEESVHFAMAQRPRAGRVLLVSGGASGTAREVLKYGVAAVDYVELDPEILGAAARFLPENLRDPRIHAINADGRRYVKETAARYDVVILDVPDPSTSQLNRFYTREFFAEVRHILVPGGVLALSLGQYEGYLGDAMARVLAIAYRTLKEVYANVLIVPGEKVFFLASDAALTADIAGRIRRAGVATRWVVPSYLEAILKPDRLAEIDRALAADAPVNEDFSPLLYYFHLRYWMSQFKVRFGFLEGALLGLLAIYLVRIRPISLAIFTAGFTASALEVVLLLGFQVLCGSVYRQVGLIVTMFMLGLGVGSYWMGRMLPRRRRGDLAWLQLLLAAYAACLPLAVLGLGRLGGGLGPAAAEVAVPLLTLLLAVLVGMSFPLAAKLDFCNVAATAARLYTADYVGAALGALLVSTWLIPLLGVAVVCWLTAGLCVLSGVVLAASA